MAQRLALQPLADQCRDRDRPRGPVGGTQPVGLGIVAGLEAGAATGIGLASQKEWLQGLALAEGIQSLQQINQRAGTQFPRPMGVAVVAHHLVRQPAVGIRRLEPVAERCQRREPPHFMAAMARPAGRIGQRLAQIMGQGREAHRRIGREPGRLIQHHQAVDAGIDLRVMQRRLRYAE